MYSVRTIRDLGGPRTEPLPVTVPEMCGVELVGSECPMEVAEWKLMRGLLRWMFNTPPGRSCRASSDTGWTWGRGCDDNDDVNTCSGKCLLCKINVKL